MRLVLPVFPNVPDLGVTTIAKNQPEYKPVPSYVSPSKGTVTMRWHLDWKERFKLLFSGSLWLTVLTRGQSLQPFKPSVDNPAQKCADGHIRARGTAPGLNGLEYSYGFDLSKADYSQHVKKRDALGLKASGLAYSKARANNDPARFSDSAGIVETLP